MGPMPNLSPRYRRGASLLSMFTIAIACGRAPVGDSATPQDAPQDTSDAEPALAYEPGGMWMPSQMPAFADTFEAMGFRIAAGDLADPTRFPLGAIVSLGGCSASFVSPEGLVITNHHCVTGALQHNSSKDRNLLHDGYLARTRSEELWAGPRARVYVTQRMEDVTEQVRGDLAEDVDPRERARAIERRVKDLVAACERGRPEIRCTVRPFFEGAEYHLVEQLEIRDVRLVYAPHAGIGVFGGEVDNWRWPRHTGDFAFLRAYVGPDGKPAEHAADNVPYRPPHHLKVAKAPLAAGDPVFVAGYPGRTYRLKTAHEVREAVEFHYPHLIESFDAQIATLEELAKQDPEVGIKVASRLRGLHNYRTNFQGMLDGLEKGGLAEAKAALEQNLAAWIAADPDRTKTYGSVLDELAALFEAREKTRMRRTAERELLGASDLLDVATTIVDAAYERAKPDAERRPSYQDRNLPNLERWLDALERTYDRRVDAAMLELFVDRARRLPPEDRPTEVLEALLGKDYEGLDAAAVRRRIAALFERTQLEDAKTRKKLFRTARPARLRRSKDPFVRIAMSLRDLREARRAEDEAFSGALDRLRPRYIAALRAHAGKEVAPDANGTLRITFGTVRGYRPAPDADVYEPFTTFRQLAAKHTGKEPFAAPDALLAAIERGTWGPYAAPELGEVPLDFLADLDITGGNSGSATLNAAGELVGLAFDGNYESIASDWLFVPEVTRSIHVDVRAILWILDAVDHGDHLLEEMGVEPSIDGKAPPKAG